MRDSFQTQDSPSKEVATHMHTSVLLNIEIGDNIE